MIILDTNVLSELMRPTPTARVVSWIAAQPVQSLFTTGITQAEILFGVMMLPGADGAKLSKRPLKRCSERISPVGSCPSAVTAALSYGRIAVNRRRAGRPISQSDAQIAAIAF